MFTGLIEELGSIASRVESEAGARIVINAGLIADGLGEGDSVAVNGVCLTALDITPTTFAADLSPETLERTTLGRLAEGTRVNLERAVTPSTRLGGHIVQGHVDGRGAFVSAVHQGDYWTVTIRFPVDLAKYFVEKGSVSVEGISLTIAHLYDTTFDIAIIPKTWTATNLSNLSPGDAVNLEVDVIAKYVERMMAGHR
jgi:riboflavin synthase